MGQHALNRGLSPAQSWEGPCFCQLPWRRGPVMGAGHLLSRWGASNEPCAPASITQQAAASAPAPGQTQQHMPAAKARLALLPQVRAGCRADDQHNPGHSQQRA